MNDIDVLFAFPQPVSDVKEMDPLTSWKMVSPCPMVRCGCGCCCWARRCFCLADWRHMVIISVHASILARNSSHASVFPGNRRVAAGRGKSRWPAFGEQEAAGQQVWRIRSEATWAGTREELWNFVGAELTAPPAGAVLIGPYTLCTLPLCVFQCLLSLL